MLTEEEILSANVLIVDDNILNVQILKKILTDAGFCRLTFTTDSTKALDIYKEIHPDLVLLDFNMPNLNGIEVMEQMRALEGDHYLPVLMLSAEEDPSLRARALQAGAKDFLKKPYDRLEGILRSRKLIEVRVLYNQIRSKTVSLEDSVKARTKELRQTQIDVVYRLAKVAEHRDADTGKHIIRMSRYSQALAKTIGFTPAQCELILNTSPLHDIGKIAIPDAILLKPAKLDPAELEIMKTHTTLGAAMLADGDSVFLSMAQTIALSHHEKFDGTGYPRQLRGDEIPLVGRICAIADVFDALTSVRPYKKSWSIKEAQEEIRKSSGTHFDPKLVEAFFDAEKDFESIYKEYQ